MKAFGSNSDRPLPYIDPVVLLDNESENQSEFNKLVDALSNTKANTNTDAYNTSNTFNTIDTSMDDGIQYLRQNKYDCHEWAFNAWDRAVNNGIIDGTRPKDTVTREELIVILSRLDLF